MNTARALARLEALSLAELRHRIQLMQADIDTYRNVIAHYPPERRACYGLPYLERLEARKAAFTRELRRRKQS
jgi:hypothetical protein